MKPLRVVIAGGGTGGHLYPGIAVARELLRRRPDARITFAGTARGIESRVVPKEGFELDTLRSTGLKGTSLAARVRGLLLIPLSGIDAWAIVSRRAPDSGDWRGRVQLGPGRADRVGASHPDAAARAECGARLDEPAARARRQRRGRDVRIDGGLLRKEGHRRRQPGSVRVHVGKPRPRSTRRGAFEGI